MSDSLPAVCPALFEPRHRPRNGTHSCELRYGHDGDHHCPVCGLDWEGVRLYMPTEVPDV